MHTGTMDVRFILTECSWCCTYPTTTTSRGVFACAAISISMCDNHQPGSHAIAVEKLAKECK